ncbi:MAG: hypothetical protein NVS2B11_01650 [Acetobacteraceae bacterium]
MQQGQVEARDTSIIGLISEVCDTIADVSETETDALTFSCIQVGDEWDRLHPDEIELSLRYPRGDGER